jgi:hypothetical protein
MPSSRACFYGHTIQEKTTVSSTCFRTASGKDISFPLGTSSPPAFDDLQSAVILEDRCGILHTLPIGVSVRGRHYPTNPSM